MTGVIIIFTRLTNIVPSGFSSTAKLGAARPVITPATTATSTAVYSQCVAARRLEGLSSSIARLDNWYPFPD
jgi:hypothetical protein